MVKMITGGKGSGKSKRMIEMANELINCGKGHVVYIDIDKRPMYDLQHEIRFTSMDDYPARGDKGFLGFLCGMIANDHDIEAIFIDGLLKILGLDVNSLRSFMMEIKMLSQKFNIDFILSISCDEKDLPEELNEYSHA